jgi:hypothetical protein
VSATEIAVAVLGGGALGSIVSQALAIQNERSVRIRNEKIEAFKSVLEANEAALAALTDSRHALEAWEGLVEQKEPMSREDVATLEEARRFAKNFEGADTAAHAAMRESRRRSFEMMMMFAPKAGLRQAVLDQREAFHRLRECLNEIRDVIGVANPERRVEREELWAQLKRAREARYEAEACLIAKVHPALWPWWHRRRLGSRLHLGKMDS